MDRRKGNVLQVAAVIMVLCIVGSDGTTYLESTSFNPSGVPAGTTRLIFNGITIGTIPGGGVFSHLTQLTSLEFWSSSVTTIEATAFQGLTALTFIDLTASSLTSLPNGVFQDLNSLTSLDLKNNMLTQSLIVPGIWSDVKDTLVILNLYGNKFTSITRNMFEGFTNLQQLNLAANEITSVQSQSFTGLDSLTLLDLSYNNIPYIMPETFLGLSSLQSLNLRNTQINNINANGFKGLSSIRSLFMSSTQLASVPWNAFDPTDFASSGGHPQNLAMDVSANFFMCNEALQWIKIGERDGWITLTPPICARQQNTPWASITLPGNIDFMCGSGYRRNIGELICEPCGYGYYSFVNNVLLLCHECPDGGTTNFMTAGQPSQCLQCQNGQERGTFSSCVNCGPGTFRSFGMQDFCTECQAGLTSGVAAVSCNLDINECGTNNGGCSHTCGNNFGSFTCGCPTGWSLMADRLTCRENPTTITDATTTTTAMTTEAPTTTTIATTVAPTTTTAPTTTAAPTTTVTPTTTGAPTTITPTTTAPTTTVTPTTTAAPTTTPIPTTTTVSMATSPDTTTAASIITSEGGTTTTVAPGSTTTAATTSAADDATTSESGTATATEAGTTDNTTDNTTDATTEATNTTITVAVTAASTSDSSDDDLTMILMIVGFIIAALLLIVLIIVIIVCICRRKQSEEKQKKDEEQIGSGAVYEPAPTGKADPVMNPTGSRSSSVSKATTSRWNKMAPKSSTSAFIAPVAVPASRSEENEYQEANDVRQSFVDRNSSYNEYSNSIESAEKAPAHYTGNEGKSESRWNEGDSGYSDQSPAPDPRASRLSNIPETRDSAISETPRPESTVVPDPPEPRDAPQAPAKDPEQPKSVKGYFDSDTDDEDDVTHHNTNRVSWQTPFFASY